MPRPNAIQASQRFRAQLLRQEAEAARRMAVIYGRIATNLRDEIAKLADEIAALGDEAPKSKLLKLARLKSIQIQVAEEVTRFGGVVQNEIAFTQSEAIRQGIDNAMKLMELSLPALPAETRRQILASLTVLPGDAIEAAAGLLGPDSPLTPRLTTVYGDYVANQVTTHLLDGIAIGQNPRRIAQLLNRNLNSSLGSGLTSALTTIRTAQIKSYQLANHATYTANANIVPQWIWHAALDDRTCMSCINQHGSVHPVSEVLTDHYNGRCAPLPKTITYRDLGLDIPEVIPPVETGEQWFNRQSSTTQRQLMSGASYRAWKAGKIGIGDFSKRYDDEVYGELLREASLKDILGKQAKGFYAISS